MTKSEQQSVKTSEYLQRGSIWRKWDLQIQPIKSEWFADLKNKTEEIKNATREYLKKAIQKKIDVVAITDHNTGIAVDLALEVLKEDDLDIHILPGVEIETPEGWHCIVIFNPAYKEAVNCTNWDDTIQAFLRNIGGMSGKFFNDDGTARQVEIHTKDLIGEITKKDIGIFIFAHCDADKGFFKRGNNTTRKEILEENIKGALPLILDSKELKHKDIQAEVRNIIGNQGYELAIPVVSTSDAHKLEEVGRFTWIKADPIYDGLKQIIYEPQPEERVYIGELAPTYKNTSKVIDRIEIKSSKKWFTEESILLNENLVSVIGEKGSGKTALADFIALAGGDFIQDEKDQASFIYKALIPTKQIAETIEDCEITLHWKNNEKDTIVIDKELSKYQPNGRVKYLSQSFIEKRCRPEHFEELQREIEDIIFQHVPIPDRLGETTFEGLKKRKTTSIEVQKEECRRNISDLNAEIYSLEEDISSLDKKRKEKTDLEKEQGELEKQKPKPATNKEKEIEKKLTSLNEHKENLEGEVAKLNSHLTTIESIKTKTASLKKYAKQQLSNIQVELKTIGLAEQGIKFSITPNFLEEVEKKQEKIKTKIKQIKGAPKTAELKNEGTPEMKPEDLKEETIKDLTLDNTQEWIDKLESVSSVVESTRKAIKEYEGKILKIKKRVGELNKNITEIETVKVGELPKKVSSRNEAYKELFKVLASEKKALEELYSPLKDKTKKEKETQMEFFARIELGVDNFNRKAKTVLDFSKKGHYYRGDDSLYKKIKDVAEVIELGEVEDIAGEMQKFYDTFLTDKEGKKITISSQLLKGKNRLDFYNWFFDTADFKVAYNIKYQKTSLELLSPGKKGIVLLLMYLVLDTEGSVPLIIDQPEENLDNKSVFPSLVDYFREIKRRRQVIVITHNPNLVLNTDAEQIIVANFDAVPSSQPSRISYVSGAIENSFVSKKAKIPLEKRGIREHGLDILEGGRIAFRKRREKYGKTAE